MRILLLTCFLCCGSVLAAPEPAATETPAHTPTSFETWASGKLRLGVRLGWADLEEGSMRAPGTPSGENWRLDEGSDVMPALHAQYTLCPHGYGGLGAGCEWLDVEVSEPAGDGAETIGDLKSLGTKLYIFSQYPNRSRFTPFGEFGVAHYFTDFDNAGGVAARGLDADDATAWFISLGGRVELAGHWSVELAYRRLGDADVDVRAAEGRSSLPLDHDTISAGVSHRF